MSGIKGQKSKRTSLGRDCFHYFQALLRGWQIEPSRSRPWEDLEEGVQLLELANRAHDLFQKQPPSEKRRLLNFVLSNCTWKGGELSAEFRQPFDMLAFRTMGQETKKAADGALDSPYKNWLLGQDSNLEPFG